MNRFVIAVRASLDTVLATILATLREIFDEAAYARFLGRARMTSSPTTYAAFCRELEEAKARRPKCC
jgi:hypothetical protein